MVCYRCDKYPFSLQFLKWIKETTRADSFEPRHDHMSDKLSSAYGYSDGVSQGSPVFAPTYD